MLLSPALILLVGLVFANSFPGAFIADDYSRVLENPLVLEPDLATLFQADYWGYGLNSGLHRPLTILSYAANMALFGPGILSFHAVNVLLHAGVVLLLFVTFTAMGVALPVAWFASALFAVHPIHTEVLNIVTGRAELLAAAFLLMAWRFSLVSSNWKRYAGTALCYAAALLSKENAVTFPLLLVIGDAFMTRDYRRQVAGRGGLYLVLSIMTLMWLAMRIWWLPFSGIPINEIYPLDNPLVDLPAIPRILGIAKVQFIYLSKMIFPIPLQALYTSDTIRIPAGPIEPQVIAIAAAALLFGALLVRGWRKREWYGAALAFYIVAFSVTANIVRLTTFLMAERFAYLPSAGFCLAIASLAIGNGRFEPGSKRVWLLAAFLIFLGSITVTRNPDFRSSTALWTAEVRNAPGNPRAWMFLGGSYDLEGRRGEAEGAYRSAIRIAPGFVDASLSLGYLLLAEGKGKEAQDCFESAYRRLTGGSPLLSLALARTSLVLGDPEKSLEWLEEVEPYSEQLPEYWAIHGDATTALEIRKADGRNADGAR